MAIEDKQLLNKAIEDTDILSLKQKEVFKIICESEYPVSSVTIENSMKVTRQAVYLTLKALLDRDFINRKKERIFLYYPNKLKILELIERYKFNRKLLLLYKNTCSIGISKILIFWESIIYE